MKSWKKHVIFLPAFYPIMCLMKSAKNLEIFDKVVHNFGKSDDVII